MNDLHTFEISLIKPLHEYRNPIFDAFFKAMNFLDTDPFYFIILPIIWLGIDWKWGVRIFFVVMLCTLLVQDLKDLFVQPRPFDLAPELAVIKVKGYGIPSGAALVSSCILGWLALVWRNKWVWLFAFCYIGLLGFSRVYLGVHFISDVLMGWMIGGTLAYLCYRFERPLEIQLSRLDVTAKLLLLVTISLAVLGLHVTTKGVQVAFTSIGAGLGLLVMELYHIHFNTKTSLQMRILRSAIGVLGVLIIVYTVELFPKSYTLTATRSLISGLWVSLLAPLLFMKFNFTQANAHPK